MRNPPQLPRADGLEPLTFNYCPRIRFSYAPPREGGPASGRSRVTDAAVRPAQWDDLQLRVDARLGHHMSRDRLRLRPRVQSSLFLKSACCRSLRAATLAEEDRVCERGQPSAGRPASDEAMRRNRLLGPTSLGMALALFGCEQVRTEAVSPPRASVPKQSSPSPSVSEELSRPRSWRKERFISVTEAVERLQPHVDVPVVLPKDRTAGLPNLKGWLADPKYLYWETADEVRSGTLTLRKGRQILILSFGLAVFDGCGDRDHAIETNVLGRSALFSQAREHVLEPGPVARHGYGLDRSLRHHRHVRGMGDGAARRIHGTCANRSYGFQQVLLAALMGVGGRRRVTPPRPAPAGYGGIARHRP